MHVGTFTWLQYAYQPMDYDATFSAVRSALLDGVFGPPKGGVYSPSVQFTLWVSLLARRLPPPSVCTLTGRGGVCAAKLCILEGNMSSADFKVSALNHGTLSGTELRTYAGSLCVSCHCSTAALLAHLTYDVSRPSCDTRCDGD
jgi:hypothetical protein